MVGFTRVGFFKACLNDDETNERAQFGILTNRTPPLREKMFRKPNSEVVFLKDNIYIIDFCFIHFLASQGIRVAQNGKV